MEVGALLADAGARAAMRESALVFCASHRGAADRLWKWLAPKLPPKSGGKRSEQARPQGGPQRGPR
jgi:hypothetical protein